MVTGGGRAVALLVEEVAVLAVALGGCVVEQPAIKKRILKTRSAEQERRVCLYFGNQEREGIFIVYHKRC